MLFVISYSVAAAFGLAYALLALLHMCRSMNSPVPLQPPSATTGVKRKHHKRRRALAAAKSQTSVDSKSKSRDDPFSDASQETLVDADSMKDTNTYDKGRPESNSAQTQTPSHVMERPKSLPRRMTSMCRKNATLCYFSIPLPNVIKKGEDQDTSIVQSPSENLQEEEADEPKTPKPPSPRRQNSTPISTFSDMMKNKKIVPGLAPVTRTTKLAIARTAPTLKRTLTPFQGLRR